MWHVNNILKKINQLKEPKFIFLNEYNTILKTKSLYGLSQILIIVIKMTFGFHKFYLL